MKLTIISDTHMRHDELGVLGGEVLIHCGDLFDLFDPDGRDLKKVDAWLSKQRFDLILCIAGNHDRPLEAGGWRGAQPFDNAIYLEDGAWDFDGVTFYGTPWVPRLRDHAFYAGDAERRKRWSRIPSNTDVLITHVPPAGVLDRSSRGMEFGCEHLAFRVAEVLPKVHCFGHVHASGGVWDNDQTTFVNASSVDRPRGPLRAPYIIDA